MVANSRDLCCFWILSTDYYNGIMELFFWVVSMQFLLCIVMIVLQLARVVLFIFFFIHMWIHFDEVISFCFLIPQDLTDVCCSWINHWTFNFCCYQVKTIFPLGFYCILTVPATLAILNLFWFWKIAKGMVKTLSKAAKHKQWSLPCSLLRDLYIIISPNEGIKQPKSSNDNWAV